MTKKNYIVLIVILLVGSVQAQQPLELVLQERGEVVVSVEWEHLKNIENIESLSIEMPVNGKSMVYLNAKQYNYFIENNIPFVPEVAPSFLYKAKMANDQSEMSNWDAYPSYEVYLDLMEQFTKKFPDLCQIDTIGYSTNKRLLLALKITANINNSNARPEFLYSSSMHGDELVGYVLMLRLADYLLNNMDNEQVASLVNNVNIYINPLANPDGTFYTSNSTVSGAKRFNANFVDINRNFPDPKRGDHPDGEQWQPETVAMMNFMEKHNFVLSMNHHGGIEVINYPWDTFSKRHADDEWFKFISRDYVDTVHAINDTYMTDLSNGITNGYDWYEVAGGRQDYVNYFLRGREITSELSTVKLPDAGTLPDYWNYNYKSLLNYINQALYGVTGFVTNSLGNPLKATITIPNYDEDSTHVRTQESGVYYRFLKGGKYTMVFEADGYETREFTDVIVEDFMQTELSVILKKHTGINDAKVLSANIYPNPANELINIEFSEYVNNTSQIAIYNVLGKQVHYSVNESSNIFKISIRGFSPGIYHISIRNGVNSVSEKLIIN